jgi:hypothetical protein
MLGRSISQCDFFEFCGVECLVWVKKVVEELNENKKGKGPIEFLMKKLEEDIERQISSKNL